MSFWKKILLGCGVVVVTLAVGAFLGLVSHMGVGALIGMVGLAVILWLLRED